MESVLSLLHTAHQSNEYWEDAARDTIINHNLLLHSNLHASLYALWHGTKPPITKLCTFGQLGTIPIYAPKKKTETRAQPARYMYANSLTHVTVLIFSTYHYRMIHSQDFHPYYMKTDPFASIAQAFAVRTPSEDILPRQTTINTLPPGNLQQA